MGETLQAGIAQLRQQLAALDDSPASREFARRHRLTAKQLGRPPADPAEQRALTLRCLEQSREVIRISRCLQEHGIRHAFIKGIPLSMLAWGCVDARRSSDIDLLVAPADIFRVLDILRQPAFGYIADEELSAFTCRQTACYLRTKHHYCLHSPASSSMLEVHWRLTDDCWVLPDVLSKGALQDVDLFGSPVPTLDNETLLVYLCAHGSHHAWYQLKWLFDIPALIGRCRLDWEKIWSVAENGACLNQLVQGLLLAVELLDLGLPASVLERVKAHALPARLREFPITAMQGPDSHWGVAAPFGVRLEQMRYGMAFLDRPAHYASLLERHATHPADWAALKLPDKLFFLYYPLRPLLIAYRRFLRRQQVAA